MPSMLITRTLSFTVRSSMFACPLQFSHGKQWRENEKKALRQTQTLHAGCSKTEPKNFALPHTPFPEAQDGQNLISWRWSLPLPTNPVWWRSMHAISSYRGNRPTNKHTDTHTNKPRQDRLKYTARQLAHNVIRVQIHMFNNFTSTSEGKLQK